LGAAALFHFFKQEGTVHFLYVLLAPLLLAYGISIASAVLLPRVGNLQVMAHLQVDFDVLLISGIIWITGDSGSPFSFLYNLAVMNGAILLFYPGAFLTAVFSSLCYGGLVLASYNYHGAGLLSWPFLMPVVLNIGSFFVIACLSGFLAGKLAQAEKLLKDKQLEYQELDAFKDALLQGVGSGVAITDPHGFVNYLNSQAQRLTLLDQEKVKGKRLDEIFPGLTCNFDGVTGADRVIADEIPFALAGGISKQLRLTVAPLSDSNRQVIGYLSIFEDITRQKDFEDKLRLEEELREARQVELQPGTNGDIEVNFRFEGVIGKSGGMEAISRLVQKVAAGSTNVLITGESGTGKELVARAIHFNGPRKDKPFIAVNCGAIPETLIESELFGHIRGAFTGAVADRIGLFKQADQGTIFLDEVGELPLHLQVKLLRVLQEKTFTAVGANRPTKVDVRVISATNRDLSKAIEGGQFREDLFYRINVVHVAMPPLRSRKQDVPILAHFFLRKFAASHQKNVEEISSRALMRLMNHNYPGNVRELENIIEHAVAVTNMNTVTEEDLPVNLRGAAIGEEADVFEQTAPGGADAFFTKGLSLEDELETHEKCILLGAMKRSNGVQKRAAEILGINYRSLRHRLEKYGLLNPKNLNFLDEPKQ
jgi:two-component system response regulator PilR (NtrC family)